MKENDMHTDKADTAPKIRKQDDIVELFKAIIIAAVLALTVRTLAYEPFNIPSGSMLPTLKVGDYLFVQKYSYGYGRYSFPFNLANFDGRILGRDPARGDIAVFRQPRMEGVDYIKRIIGLPGDTVQVKDGVLHVNGKAVMRDLRGTEFVESDGRKSVLAKYIETLPNGVQHYIYEASDREDMDNTPAFTVPAGHYFAMGDNRDNSLDSRSPTLGFVPAQNLVGRAQFIFFSTKGIGNSCKKEGGIKAFDALATFGCSLIEWPKAIRYNRIFTPVQGLRP